MSIRVCALPGARGARSRLPGGWAGRPTWLVPAQPPGDLGPSCRWQGRACRSSAPFCLGWALETHSAYLGKLRPTEGWRVGMTELEFLKPQSAWLSHPLGGPGPGGQRAACSRPRFSFQTFIFTDGDDEALARRTGEPWTWGGRGGSGGSTPGKNCLLPSPLQRGLGGHGPEKALYSTGLLNAPPRHWGGHPILMQMRSFQLPGPFELMWRQQVAGAGKKPPEWAGAGPGLPWRGLGWGGGRCCDH